MSLKGVNSKALSDKQLEVIDLMVGRTEENLSKKEIAERVGVSRQTIYNWMKDEAFRGELVKQAKTVVDSGLAAGLSWAERAMLDPRVKDGTKVKLLDLFMKSKGMLKDQGEADAPTVNVNIGELMSTYGIKNKAKDTTK